MAQYFDLYCVYVLLYFFFKSSASGSTNTVLSLLTQMQSCVVALGDGGTEPSQTLATDSVISSFVRHINS